MHRILTRFISLLIVAVFTFYTVPHEAVHLFYDHEDTEHHDCENGTGLSISEKHIHCDFLSGYETDYVTSERIIIPANSTETVRVFIAVDYISTERYTPSSDSRGPPIS
jgi:hypothetical protein